MFILPPCSYSPLLPYRCITVSTKQGVFYTPLGGLIPPTFVQHSQLSLLIIPNSSLGGVAPENNVVLSLFLNCSVVSEWSRTGYVQFTHTLVRTNYNVVILEQIRVGLSKK